MGRQNICNAFRGCRVADSLAILISPVTFFFAQIVGAHSVPSATTPIYRLICARKSALNNSMAFVGASYRFVCPRRLVQIFLCSALVILRPDLAHAPAL